MDLEKGPHMATRLLGSKSYMAFTRHNWDEPAVFHSILSNRVDRYALFLQAYNDVTANSKVANLTDAEVIV